MAAALLSSRSVPSSGFQFFHVLRNPVSASCLSFSISISNVRCDIFPRSYTDHLTGIQRRILKPICAADSGVETSVIDSIDGKLSFKKVEISVEVQDASKLQLRVDVTGEETQKAFDVTLLNLARDAPPIPGFRRQKGGKTLKVPKGILLKMLGEERVTKFVIQEIVHSIMSNYVNKENLTVKDNKISTDQTEDELKRLFSPGNPFGFNVTIELQT